MIDIAIVRKITEKTGCYIFKNKDGQIIYIGKANNIKKRVLNHFQNEEGKARRMFIGSVEEIETIITENKKEALILEQNLIKKWRPRHNVLLKDGNSYPYIQITDEKDPRYLISYRTYGKGKFFGPFPDGTRAKEIFELLEKILPLAKCRRGERNEDKKPCLYYEMKQCSGHCFKNVEKGYYDSKIKEVEDFFEGKVTKIKKEIEKMLKTSITNLSFETAQKQKKILNSIDFFVSSQNIEFKDRKNRDFIGIFQKDNYLAINILMYRYGKLTTSQGKVFFIDNLLANEEEILESYIFYFYRKNIGPEYLFSQEKLEFGEQLEKETKIKNLTSKEENIRKILENANSNAKELWRKEFFSNFQKIRKWEILEKLAALLKIKIPKVIEGLDISNIFLSDSVGSFSKFINGDYISSKHYNLERQNSDIDYVKKSCQLHYQKNGKNEVDLLIIDGGKEQLKFAKKALEENGVNLAIISLVKNEKHKTDRMILSSLEEVEIVDHELKNFLSEVQEIVHHNAISKHRKLRIKNVFDKKRES